MQQSRVRKNAQLGDILVELGVITSEQLKIASAQSDPELRTLGPTLISLGFATEENIE